MPHFRRRVCAAKRSSPALLHITERRLKPLRNFGKVL
jgi:hypothetical protein